MSQPVLNFADMVRLRNIAACTEDKFLSAELDICYPLAWGNEGVEARIASLCAEAEDAVHRGCGILIVSDRHMNQDNVAIPALLATSAVHQHLVCLLYTSYHAAMMEPWDGPAAVAFTDGCQIGATLDRNGLRPARYLVTDDDLVVMSSEAGVLPIPEENIIKKWRLQPGKMFLIDLDQGRIIDDLELKETLSRQKPYRDWVARINVKLSGLDLGMHVTAPEYSVPLLKRQQAFGFSQEDIKFILEPLARTGEEATGSMGNDTPLAVLSNKDKSLFMYFRQLFAQVTNPPIDSIREQLVMSLVSFIGPKPKLLRINEINPPYRLSLIHIGACV